MDELLLDFYSKPTQIGGELPYFEGERYNAVGGGFLGNVGRFLLPIIKTIGKEVLGIGAKTANDIINRDESPLKALKRNTFAAAKRKVDSFINNNPNQFDKRRNYAGRKI